MNDVFEDNSIETDLLLRYVREATSDEEDTRVEEWSNRDPENENILRQLATIHHVQKVRERLDARDPEQLWRQVRRKRRRARMRTLTRRTAAVAACVALVVSAGLNLRYLSGMFAADAVAQAQYVTIETNPGMRGSFDLPDGTVVHLNSSSRLTYPIPYDPAERRVTLVGEGYFEVAENAGQPFTVSVADDRMRVRVLGTKFNINAYEDDERIYATLVEGSVALQFTDGADRVVAERSLVPNQRLVHDTAAGTYEIATVDPLTDYAWTEGKLIFKDTPMPEVLHKISNLYSVDFEVAAPVIDTYKFTGTFAGGDVRQLLRYIEISSQIHFDVVTPDASCATGRTRVVLSKK